MTREEAEKIVDDAIKQLPTWPKLSEEVRHELREYWIERVKEHEK